MNPPPNSRLANLHLQAADDPCESLVVTLRAVFRAYGRSIDHDELAAATGVAFVFTCAPNAPDPTWWPAYGRDAFLQPAARTYGLDLRELHPPDAAPTPSAPVEFTVHFRDSYVPFIETALRRDEPVLAWMGWPAPDDGEQPTAPLGAHTAEWGVITDIDPSSRRCAGYTPANGNRRVLMTGPPAQVYIVQGYMEAQPTREQILRTALHHAAAVLNNKIDASFGVLSGPAALERWRDALTLHAGTPGLGLGTALPHTGLDPVYDARVFHPCLTRGLVSSRRAAIRFLERFRGDADTGQAKTLDTCVAAFRELVACMTPACDLARVSAQLQTDHGRRALSDALTRALELERRVAQATAALHTDAP